jgi:hypothetical protein
MKKSTLLVLICLYALTPSAQITKTLNGTVSYRSGIAETKFNTPSGNVIVSLPESMTGAVISGTVSVQPEGKTEQDRHKNMIELLKYNLNLDGNRIPLTETPSKFNWLTHIDRNQGSPLELYNLSGKKIASAELPTPLPAPRKPSIGRATIIPKSLPGIKGEDMSVYTNQEFPPGTKFIITDSKGNNYSIDPICLSADQAVLRLPPMTAVGECTLIEEGRFNASPGNKEGAMKFYLADLQLSSPNTNLRPGERSSVLANVIVTDDKGEWIHPDLDHWFGSLRLDLKNLNPNVVTMQGGNLQRVNIGNGGPPQNGIYPVRREIVGNTMGAFSVSATLHTDFNSSNDIFQPQLNALKTPADYNNWLKAIKSDLRVYAELPAIEHATIKANIDRALQNLPTCNAPAELEGVKSRAYSLLRPIDVPRGAATTWQSSFEVFKAAMNQPEKTLIDLDVVTNGLDQAERLSYLRNDPSIRSEITAARSLVESMNGGEQTPEKVKKLKDYVRTISKNWSKAVSSAGYAWTSKDLSYATYCFQKKTESGIDPIKSMIANLDPDNKILRVRPEYQEQILRSLNAKPMGNNLFEISMVTPTLTSVTSIIAVQPLILADIYSGDWWAEYLIREYIKKDTAHGKIITTHRDSTGTWYIFFRDAKCTQSEFEKGWTTPCRSEGNWDSKEEKMIPTGRYYKYTSNPRASCLKGTDFCTEVYVISGITYIYQDANCNRLIATETSYHFSCL